jgi:hypothetical protein
MGKKVNDVNEMSNADPFLLLRGYAITAYATLEQSLCLLFSILTGISRDIAGIVFFKITSARSRNALVEELLQKNGLRQPYAAFWKDYFNKLGQLDQRRNEIVHWATVTTIDTTDQDNPRITTSLVPAKYGVALSISMAAIKEQDMKEFIQKCDIYARACNMFTSAVLQKVEPSPDIFQQPIPDPLPDTHPLFRKRKEQRSPRPPSLE